MAENYRTNRLKDRWCVVWGTGKDRKRYRLPKHIITQADADEELRRFVSARKAIERAETGDLAPLMISSVYEQYCAYKQMEGKNTAQAGYAWKALKPLFGSSSVASLNSTITFRDKQLTLPQKFAIMQDEVGYARDTIWNQLSYLRTWISWAYKQSLDGLPKRQPYIWVPSKGDPRDVVPEEWEVRKILECCRAPHIRLFALIAITTGARKGAILDLTWDRIDFDRRIIDFRSRQEKDILDKSSLKGRAVVEFDTVLELALHEAEEVARSNYVVEYKGKKVNDVKKGFAAAVARAGLSHRKIGPHSFRRGLATFLADERIDMREIQKMLGHKDIKTTEQIYARYRTGYLSRAANVINLKLAKEA